MCEQEKRETTKCASIKYKMPKKAFKSRLEQTETYAQHQSRSKLTQKQNTKT